MQHLAMNLTKGPTNLTRK